MTHDTKDPDEHTLSVQEAIDLLQTVKDKTTPLTVWINSQFHEPIFTGCDRIPVVHIDVVNSGTVDVNCEFPYEQLQIWDEVYEYIKDHKLDINQTVDYLKRLIKGYATYKELLSLEQYRLAWLNLAYNSAMKMRKQFKEVKKILQLNYDSPSVEQIIEHIQLNCQNVFES